MEMFPRRQIGFTDEPKLREDFLLPSVPQHLTPKSDANGIQGSMVDGGAISLVMVGSVPVQAGDNYVVVSLS